MISASGESPTPQRLVALDLIRGVAVLGILAINIAGFAGPMIAATTPNLPHPVSPLDETAYALALLFFEGKMRGLFSMLFGAGLVLFSERADAAGRDGDQLQVRRLFWLMAIGFAHYILLWWGDILFVYAVCGLLALTLRHVSTRLVMTGALAFYLGWHIWSLIELLPGLAAEQALSSGHASAAQRAFIDTWRSGVLDWAAQEGRESHLSFLGHALAKLSEQPLWQIDMLSGIFGETLPLMALGMACYRLGVFSGAIRPGTLLRWGMGLTVSGLGLTALFIAWAWPHHFPPFAMHVALDSGLAIPHLLATLGYGALLLRIAPWLAGTALGARLIAAGRTAFSNYLATSLIMTMLFQNWGLGLFGQVGPAAQWLLVIATWAIMLTWSMVWLRYYRRGPLEWAWRSLVEGVFLPNRRQ